MYKLSPVKRLTVTEQVMEQIAELIISGKIKVGEKLPTERDLALQLNVTRARVREALRALSLVGLITIKAGEGSFVNEQDKPIPSDTIVWLFHHERNNIEEIYAARKLIESEIYLEASKFITNEDIENLQKILATLSQSDDLSSEEFLTLLDSFDLNMGQICNNSIFDKLMQTIISLRKESSLNILNVPGSRKNSVKARQTLLDNMKERNEEGVAQAVINIFKSSRDFYNTIISNS